MIFLNQKLIRQLANSITSKDELIEFIKNNNSKYDYYTLLEIIELNNNVRDKNAAFFTDEFIVEEIVDKLPNYNKTKKLRILEPSVGAGNFIPYLIKKYIEIESVEIIVNDIDKEILSVLKVVLEYLDIPKNITISFSNSDYLEKSFSDIDIIVGNPPFIKSKGHSFEKSRFNTDSKDLFSYFLEKALSEAKYISLIFPKIILGAPMYTKTRELLNKYNVERIFDFGEKGFKGIKIETVSLNLSTTTFSPDLEVISHITNSTFTQSKQYLFDASYPTWLIYRNDFFDRVAQTLQFDIFDVFRDRQITNSLITSDVKGIRILRSRNILSLKTKNIENYDKYISRDLLKSVAVSKFMNSKVVMVPNMTYYPRACWLPKNTLVNGSVALLSPKIEINDQNLEYFATKEFEDFYRICRNNASRSLNIDKTYVYYFGIKRED